MRIVDVKNLRKEYPSFRLNDVSFALEAGKITGFAGRNGAGKTTTIKSMLNLVHPDGGEITYFGMPLQGHEAEIKQRIGYSTGTVSWYPRKKLKDIAAVARGFYPGWDENAYRSYRELFRLEDDKTPLELSDGMKVKFNLLLALSHRAEILILDEFGYVPYDRTGSQLLFDYLSEIHEKKSVILNTNLEFSQWVNVLYDQRMTTALIGRLTHHVELILFPGVNNRLRESSINEAFQKINSREVGNNG